MIFFYIILLLINQINTETTFENPLEDFTPSLYETFKKKETKTLEKINKTYKQKLINLQIEYDQELSEIELELKNIKEQYKTIEKQQIIEQLKKLEIKLDLIELKLKKNIKLIEKIHKMKYDQNKILFKKYESLILKSEKKSIK